MSDITDFSSRRQFIKKASLITLGTGILAASPLAFIDTKTAPAAKPLQMSPARINLVSDSRGLNLYNSNTRERIRTVFFANGRYNKQSFNQLCYFLRDCHENATHWMDPRLLTMLHDMQHIFDNREIQVISGYRTPRTNARSHGARNSYHVKGRAVDIRIAGVPTNAIRDVAKTLRVGGVGYYPRARFVHIDTGPVRTWTF